MTFGMLMHTDLLNPMGQKSSNFKNCRWHRHRSIVKVRGDCVSGLNWLSKV